MRIHRLEVAAFGPFPGTEVVDFTPLNAAGLFLLTGPTGAGKTSILDAICFALYGGVPGDRNGAKAFKSDHASADAVPSVTLDLTVRDRRLRLRRQPGWARPSRRAKSGVVDEKAKAAIEELVDGRWITHSTRVDEVGHLVTTVLGMNKDQFCQVVMLPQGQFQTFLSAGAKERHDVLESLFRTQRFQAIERWCVDHRRRLDAECRETEASLDRVLARVEEVLVGAGRPPLLGSDTGSDTAVPTALPTAVPTAVVGSAARGSATALDYAQVLVIARAGLAALTEAANVATEAERQASEEAKVAQHALDSARTLVDHQRRHREAQNRLTELVSAAGEVRRREREVLLARRAAALEPLLTLAEEAHTATRSAVEAVATTRDALVGLVAAQPEQLGGVLLEHLETPEGVAAFSAELQRELAGLEALVDVQTELDEILTATRAQATVVEQARARETALVSRTAELPVTLAGARDLLASARDAAARLPGLTNAVTAARQVLDATRKATTLADEASTLTEALVAAREVRADARDQLHLVRTRRIAGMAATLAATLEPGRPCQVCGSEVHPSPAHPDADAVTPDDEAEAEDVLRRTEDALGQLQLRRERVRADKAAADHATAGHSPETAETMLRAAEATARACSVEAAAVGARSAELERLEAELSTARRDLAATTAAVQALDARQKERELTAARLRRRITDAIGTSASLTEHRAGVEARLDAATALLDAIRRHQEARVSERSVIDRLDSLVAGSVFATVRQVRDAVRSEADIASGEALNRAHAADKQAVEKTLADPALVRSAAAPTPDLDSLELTAEQTAAVAARATAHVGRLDAAGVRLESLVADLTSDVARWQPLRVRRDRADHVAALVTGTSRDNLTKTKLSHYVLAARLEQVVEAANLRLRGICGGRFELSHTVHRGVGDARGGLGLRVLDTYTGADRDPATLSGGETFYVSLALALGLADLVNNEVGGAELSTLFVDEGFGTLDAETLDEVMDELDGLRSGGRSVGLVSHLAELRLRVPAQLSVVRSPSGSRLDDSPALTQKSKTLSRLRCTLDE